MKDEKIIIEPDYDSMNIEKDEPMEAELENEEYVQEWKYRMAQTFLAGQ